MAIPMDEAEDLALRCCVCGTSADDDSNYLNTKMKMLISKCGHRLYVPPSFLSCCFGNASKVMVVVVAFLTLGGGSCVVHETSCDHCIKREFQHHREIPCPACQKPVKKSQLQDKTIEELNFAKETSMRKKIVKE